MRLIDADVLMADVRNTITEESGAIDWINLINRQPTAYDPDKVVEQLEDLRKAEQDRTEQMLVTRMDAETVNRFMMMEEVRGDLKHM